MPWVASEMMVSCSNPVLFYVAHSLRLSSSILCFSFLVDLILLFSNIIECLLYARHYSKGWKYSSLLSGNFPSCEEGEAITQTSESIHYEEAQRVARESSALLCWVGVAGSEGHSFHVEKWSCFFLCLSPFILNLIPKSLVALTTFMYPELKPVPWGTSSST